MSPLSPPTLFKIFFVPVCWCYRPFLSSQLLKQSCSGRKQRAASQAGQNTGVFMWHILHFLLKARFDVEMCFGLWQACWESGGTGVAGVAEDAGDGIQSAS